MHDKIDNLIGTVRDCLLKRRYLLTKHAQTRLRERNILHTELIAAMANGQWIKKKDRKSLEGWNYYIRGETLDGRALGVVVSIVNNPATTIVITVIDLDNEVQ